MKNSQLEWLLGSLVLLFINWGITKGHQLKQAQLSKAMIFADFYLLKVKLLSWKSPQAPQVLGDFQLALFLVTTILLLRRFMTFRGLGFDKKDINLSNTAYAARQSPMAYSSLLITQISQVSVSMEGPQMLQVRLLSIAIPLYHSTTTKKVYENLFSCLRSICNFVHGLGVNYCINDLYRFN